MRDAHPLCTMDVRPRPFDTLMTTQQRQSTDHLFAPGKSFTTLQGHDPDALLETVTRLVHNPLNATDRLKGQLISTAFYEPSTRTRLGFQTAARKLGLDVMPLDIAASSVAKGESLMDTIRVLADYGIAALVLRHRERESMDIAISASDCPVINAGNGNGEHPVQTLIDLVMIYQKFGRLTDMNISMTGDILNGRTIHSLIAALSLFDNRITLVSDRSLSLDASAETVESLTPEILAETDVLYMTRVQVERGSANLPIVMTEQAQQDLNSDAIVLHPMPRLEELPVWFDSDPRAAYLNRNTTGLNVMMFVLNSVIP